jgi:transposase
MPHQKSSDYKETAVQYYLVEDKTQEEVCKIFKCSRRSLMRWVDKYNKDGEITGYERTPKAYKVHKKHVEFLLDEIKKNKTITIEDLLHLLKNKYPDIDLNKSHISRIIHDNNITLKMTRIRHEPTKRFGKDIYINVYSPGVNPCIIAFMAIVAFPCTRAREWRIDINVFCLCIVGNTEHNRKRSGFTHKIARNG